MWPKHEEGGSKYREMKNNAQDVEGKQIQQERKRERERERERRTDGTTIDIETERCEEGQVNLE